MKRPYLLYLRGQTYYCQDTRTGKQESLRTRDKATALRLVNARNEAQTQPAINLQIARVHLQAGDPTVATRTWQVAMDELTKLKLGETQARHISAMRDPPSTSSGIDSSSKPRPSTSYGCSKPARSRRMCSCVACTTSPWI